MNDQRGALNRGRRPLRRLLLAPGTLLLLMPGIVEAAESLVRSLPDATLFNAEIIEGPELFTPENLYQYINGAAEAFITYDFEQLAHQIYSVEGTEVTVDIYDMGTCLNAFGIYSSERGRDSKFLEIGGEAYRTGEILNFFQDRYYAKLDAFSETSQTSKLLHDFAQSVSERLPKGGGVPEILETLPSDGLVAHSRSYVRGAPLGHKFLSPAYLAEYRFGSEEMTLLLSPSKDLEEARGKLERMRERLVQVGEVLPQEKWGREAFLAQTKYQGKILGLAHGGFAVVLAVAGDSYEEFLRRLLNDLPKGVEE